MPTVLIAEAIGAIAAIVNIGSILFFIRKGIIVLDENINQFFFALKFIFLSFFDYSCLYNMLSR